MHVNATGKLAFTLALLKVGDNDIIIIIILLPVMFSFHLLKARRTTTCVSETFMLIIEWHCIVFWKQKFLAHV